MHITVAVAVAEGGSILVFQAVSPTRKAVVADRHNPIAVITLSLTLRLPRWPTIQTPGEKLRYDVEGLVLRLWTLP